MADEDYNDDLGYEDEPVELEIEKLLIGVFSYGGMIKQEGEEEKVDNNNDDIGAEPIETDDKGDQESVERAGKTS
ncbi:hypothetical protein K2173_026642 [Erythroxylum novogranatense]|uniref:Uncharacterized protein n=1 Tax=Erythroxylum novogranatense TaxID=1862640 RepID=A0AAV8U058_9ROSI|nr:hypothetical protein K2173_026642 [Erythroxylum novogranatense]